MTPFPDNFQPAPGAPRHLHGLAAYLNVVQLPELVSHFLYGQTNPELDTPLARVPLHLCPNLQGSIALFPSVIATFYAPSDRSGSKGMYRERI